MDPTNGVSSFLRAPDGRLISNPAELYAMNAGAGAASHHETQQASVPHITNLIGSVTGSGVTGFSGGSGNLQNEIELLDPRSRNPGTGHDSFDDDSDYFDDFSSESDQPEDDYQRAAQKVKQMKEKLAHDGPTSKTWNFAKRIVSLEKHRFQKEGYDLDLSYITDRIIAMGFPSQGFEGFYRNHMDDVKSFFEAKHSRRYKVYNLCTERTYDSNNFFRVSQKFKFNDH